MLPIVVIGAGAGGLSAAALLAQAGEPVLVLEHAERPGGKMRRLDVGGWAIEAGPTVLTMRGVFDAIFEQCGETLASAARLTPATVLARHAWPDGARLDLFANPEASAAAIDASFGAREAHGFRAFIAEAQRMRATLDRPFLRSTRPNPISLSWRIGLARPRALFGIRPFQSMMAALEQHFADPRLRQLFGRYATYAGSSPWHAPATLMLIAAVEQAGVWLVEGGMSALAAALAALAERQGARFRYGSEVAAILVERGRATGVRLASGEVIPARAVVYNGEPGALASGLLGAEASRAAKPGERSLSALVWTVAGTVRGMDIAHHNVFFSADYAAEFDDLARGRVPGAPTVYLCAQDRNADGTLAPHGAERLQLIVNAPPVGDAGELGDTERRRCETAMTACLARCGLTIERQAAQLTTPAAFARRFPGSGGALYGAAAHGWQAAFRRPGSRTPLTGLYLAGGATHPGAGVPMAALSGRLAAERLLRDLSSMRRSYPAGIAGGISMRSARTGGTA